ncbi:P-loop containing nucleoside triphosphate hydrolase protein [Hypoxylon sp. NC1633]|nr:P-loop containing nucleoside triphosphate hydrolase protein [Hypoxylon sp. NC1633]
MSAWGTSDLKSALPEAATQPSAPEVAKVATQPSATEAAEVTAQPSDTKKVMGDWGEKHLYDYSETDTDRQWGGNAMVDESRDDGGEVGPENPELEIQLFGPPETRIGAGLDISKITQINVFQEGEERIIPIDNFENAGIHPVMQKNIAMAGYVVPTPIQKYCIPAINMGYDLIAIAQTGSGKTAAYLVPILNQLMGKTKKLAAPRPNPAEFREGSASSQYVRAEPLILIICPARELAIQIFDEARKFCYRTMLRPCVVYGGGPMRDQLQQLGKGCDLLVATPGRLLDVMERGHILSLCRLRYLVIDEADELLNGEWDLEKVLNGGEQEECVVKYMLFSATFAPNVRALAKKHLAQNYIRVRVGRIGSSHANIKQEICFVQPELKKQALEDLLASIKPGRTIIFVNNKRMADEIDDYLFHLELPCTSMHADRTQREREDAMRAFRSGKAPILVTTGVMARGIDVHNVRHVINFDLPSFDHGGIQEYVHRIGRTGRIGYTGNAISFYTERDEPLAVDLVKTLMETQQPVPDFLQQYIPEGADQGNYVYEDEKTDSEDNAGDDGWGNGANNGGDANGGDSNADWGAGVTGAAADNSASGGGGWAAAASDWGGAPQAPAPAGNDWAPVSSDWEKQKKEVQNGPKEGPEALWS